jgi:transcriptional regulator with XRE-family HTH domain
MTNKPKYLDELIDRASKAAGNDAKLAGMMKVTRQRVSQWRHNSQPCPPADVALLAHIAGLDADAWGARALINQHEGTEKGELLKQALKKAFVATGGVIAIFGSTAAGAAEHVGYLIRCILCKPKNYQISKIDSLN